MIIPPIYTVYYYFEFAAFTASTSTKVVQHFINMNFHVGIVYHNGSKSSTSEKSKASASAISRILSPSSPFKNSLFHSIISRHSIVLRRSSKNNSTIGLNSNFNSWR
jgi:hypothetical protein